MSWFKQIFKSTKDLEAFCKAYKANQNLLNSQEKCLTDFLSNVLEDSGSSVINKLEETNFACVSVPETFGFSYYLHEIRQIYSEKAFSSIRIRASEIIRTSDQIALIILKEFKQKPSGDPLNQLKSFFKENNFLVIIENSSHVSNRDLKTLFDCFQQSKLLLIETSKEAFKTIEEQEHDIVEILPLTSERAMELALSLLNYRSDLIITSAERTELAELVALCNRMPELIYFALSGPQLKSNLAIEKYCKLIKEQKVSAVNEFDENCHKVLSYRFSKLPDEVISLYTIASKLPSGGFTLNDLFVLCRNSFFDKESLSDALQFMTYLSNLKINDEYRYRELNKNASSNSENEQKFAMVYYLPHYLKDFINANLHGIDGSSSHTVEEINSQLIQRLESNILWNEPVVWITQLEHSAMALKWIGDNKLFEDNRYFVLYIQSLFIELGFWKEIENVLIPFCSKAISLSDNNEERGFWYSLSGIMHKGISQYVDSDKQLNYALTAFQKSLKFYDPHRQANRYSFVYQNIGIVYLELAKLDDNNPVHLKQAIKAFYKAIAGEKDPCSKNTISLRRYLSQAYTALSKQEKPSENCFKAANFCIESISALKRNIPEDPRIKLLTHDLKAFVKFIDGLTSKSPAGEKMKLIDLQRQLNNFLSGSENASYPQEAPKELVESK